MHKRVAEWRNTDSDSHRQTVYHNLVNSFQEMSFVDEVLTRTVQNRLHGTVQLTCIAQTEDPHTDVVKNINITITCSSVTSILQQVKHILNVVRNQDSTILSNQYLANLTRFQCS